MIQSTEINKMKNDYILKSLFSYINYNKILDLAKINKNLQTRLGITLENYEYKLNYPNYVYVKEKNIVLSRFIGYDLSPIVVSTITILMACLCFPYDLIYSILLISLKTFNDNNLKDDYNQSELKIIKIINYCMFILDSSIIGFTFLCIFYIIPLDEDYGLKKLFKFILMVFFNLINLLSEGCAIWKLVLSYKIKKGGVKWFMVMDYIFIVFNFIYSVYFIIITLFFYGLSGQDIVNRYKYYLLSFDNIKINEYELPDDFEKMNKKERKNYILQNIDNYENNITDKQNELIDLINNLRREKDVKELEKDNNKTIPKFIMKKPAELLLMPTKNIFKLSNKKYIPKHPLNEFEKLIVDKNKNIVDILLKDNLNHIQIVNQNGIEYIFVFESNSSSEILTMNQREKREDKKIEVNEYLRKEEIGKNSKVIDTYRKKFIE